MLRKKNIILSLIFTTFTLVFFHGHLFAQLTIDTSGFITIKPGSSLTIASDFKIKSGKNNSGHLCDQTPGGSVSISGDIEIQRYFSANKWHNSACPVSNNNCGVYAGTDLVFYYDETIIQNDWNFGWVFYEGNLNPMKGYDVFLPEAETVNYTGTTSAELNTGVYSTNVTITDVPNGEIESRKGWNLIGNPYPSPLDWLVETGWEKTSINDAKYIWDHSNENYTIFLGGEEPIGLNGGTQYIPANQGFWVQASQNGSVQVNNNARCGIMQSTPGFYKTGTESYPIICLRTEVEGYYDETIIRFLKNATDQFDPGLDAYKFEGRSTNSPQIISFCDGNQMVINTLSEVKQDMSIDLGFQFSIEKICEISLSPISALNDSIDVFLKDLVTNEIIDLKKVTKFSFFHHTQNNLLRFRLYINPAEDIKNNITSDNAYLVYARGKSIFITKKTSLDVIANIKVYDMFGRAVSKKKMPDTNHFSFNLNLPSGYYVVEISNTVHRMNTIIGIE